MVAQADPDDKMTTSGETCFDIAADDATRALIEGNRWVNLLLAVFVAFQLKCCSHVGWDRNVTAAKKEERRKFLQVQCKLSLFGFLLVAIAHHFVLPGQTRGAHQVIRRKGVLGVFSHRWCSVQALVLPKFKWAHIVQAKQALKEELLGLAAEGDAEELERRLNEVRILGIGYLNLQHIDGCCCVRSSQVVDEAEMSGTRCVVEISVMYALTRRSILNRDVLVKL